MKLCDSHTHIDQYNPSELPEILERAISCDVGLIIAAGTTLESSINCIKLSEQYPLIKSGVGIHPTEVNEKLSSTTIESLNELVEQNDNVVCISETGMDYLPNSPSKKDQEHAFRAQIQIGIANKKPVIFHSRESHEDVFRILKEENVHLVGGVMHYFQGNLKNALTAIDLGCFISIARPILRIPELEQTIKNIPISNIVLETDCYPQPFKKHRSSWTEPRHLVDIASKIAEIKGVTFEQVVTTTTNNLKSIVDF